MQSRNWLGWGISLVCLALTAGCHLPGQIVWSPDGAAAVYCGKSKLLLLDANGKVFSDLGKSDGGIAWSHDSKTLYFATSADSGETIAPDEAWLISNQTVSATTQPATTAPTKEIIELKALTNGKTNTLARFPGQVLHMALSPDEHWLAICGVGSDSNDGFHIYAYHLPTKHLYLVSDNAGMAFCFTGPSRLMMEEQDTRAPSMTSAVPGRLIELTLSEKIPPTAEPLLSVIPNDTFWMTAVGDNVLFTTVARDFPGKVIDKGKDPPFKLYQWTRANGGVVSLADDVGPLFAVSPDGQRVLIERITHETDKSREKHSLEVIRANGSDGHLLRDLSPYNEFACWPAWRGNDEITFTNPTAEGKNIPADGKVAIRYEVVHYKLTDKYELEPLCTLSTGWDDDLKPYLEIEAQPSSTTTQSTTAP